MKYIIGYIALFFSCTSTIKDEEQSPQTVISKNDFDSLGKYSHFVYGAVNFIDTSGRNRGAVVQGTGFFIKNKGRLYFITAKHVLAIPDEPAIKKVTPKSNDSLMNVYMQDGTARSNMPIFYLNIKKIRDTTKDVSFINSPDVISYEVVNKEKFLINTIDNFLPTYLPENMGEICIFGFASSGNTFKGAHFVVNAKSHISIKKYSLNHRYMHDKNEYDSFNYVITPTEYQVAENLRGFSGSPAFVKDLNTNKWVFLGVMAGIHPYSNLMFFVKPKFITLDGR